MKENQGPTWAVTLSWFYVLHSNTVYLPLLLQAVLHGQYVSEPLHAEKALAKSLENRICFL